MLDIKLMRENPHKIETEIRKKDPHFSIQEIMDLDIQLRERIQQVEGLQSKRNQYAKEMGQKKSQPEVMEKMAHEAALLRQKIEVLNQEVDQLKKQVDYQCSSCPNLPDEDIPVAQDAKDNVCIKSYGEKAHFSFPPKNHLELNESLHLFDFKRGAKISGTGWPVYYNWGFRLEWALLNYMIQIHLKNGFTPWMLPHLVKPEVVYASGQLPKFKGQFYEIQDDSQPLHLIPTAEVPLNGLYIDEVIDESDLPLKFIAYTPCFRKEAGAAGAQERGLIRVHQFNKVEMFCFAHPEKSNSLFEEMLGSAEEILQGLELHYRNMLLVTGDMSFAATKTVDIEVWLPGQNRYYEVSSVSNCRDFQARRSKTKFKREKGKKDFVHTLNGSGLATARLLVAILENNQQPDGSVIIPKALRPYLGGQEILA